jgi:hypothetical protein
MDEAIAHSDNLTEFRYVLLDVGILPDCLVDGFTDNFKQAFGDELQRPGIRVGIERFILDLERNISTGMKCITQPLGCLDLHRR